ncbi:uncharacterized protein LOC143265513 [Megachile rotundata]|uniref:uncharacterized protein LOC143265513 n=1 Tax=Megachile rotundata TaxID=143995 RepID=UPI003FD2BB3D
MNHKRLKFCSLDVQTSSSRIDSLRKLNSSLNSEISANCARYSDKDNARDHLQLERQRKRDPTRTTLIHVLLRRILSFKSFPSQLWLIKLPARQIVKSSTDGF